jgi:hypothetical protein
MTTRRGDDAATCACGHVGDEHGHDSRYRGSTACAVEGCSCVAFDGGCDDTEPEPAIRSAASTKPTGKRLEDVREWIEAERGLWHAVVGKTYRSVTTYETACGRTERDGHVRNTPHRVCGKCRRALAAGEKRGDPP